MFKCMVTGRLSKPGEKLNKIVIKTREKVYYGKVLNEELRRYEEVEVGKGFEIVQEIDASEQGLEQWNAMNQVEKDLFIARYFP